MPTQKPPIEKDAPGKKPRRPKAAQPTDVEANAGALKEAGESKEAAELKEAGKIKEADELARSHTNSAITTLADVMQDATAPPTARVAAATAMLARGHGRPGSAPPVTRADSPGADLRDSITAGRVTIESLTDGQLVQLLECLEADVARHGPSEGT
ncbi:MAG TPA: hypothetical protein VNT30_10375 [Stellaceae bacterium]|nr:hypothetical protein [Stellaceae bacterium]